MLLQGDEKVDELIKDLCGEELSPDENKVFYELPAQSCVVSEVKQPELKPLPINLKYVF